MEIARAVILAVPSRDDRSWPSIGSIPKPLVPVANKPVFFHTLDALRAAGVRDAIVFVRPDAARAFRRASGDGSRWGMRLSVRECSEPLDLCEALESAAATGEQRVVVQAADAMLDLLRLDDLASGSADGLDALALMLDSERLPQQGLIEPAGFVLNAHAVSMLLAGGGGADPVMRLRSLGARVGVLDVDGCRACRGAEAALLEANRHALSRLRTEVTDAMLEDCEIQGNVVIHPTASLRNTLVRGPAIIGADTELVDSYVGPYTSIGADARIQGTEIEHSIVMDGARLMFVGSRLETSIIGRGASIVRRFDMPCAVRMMIGDGAAVALS